MRLDSTILGDKEERCLKITGNFEKGSITGKRKVETKMTEEEVEQFEEDWEIILNLAISNDKIERESKNSTKILVE